MDIRNSLGSHFIRVNACSDLVLYQSGGKLCLAWRDMDEANQHWAVNPTTPALRPD